MSDDFPTFAEVGEQNIRGYLRKQQFEQDQEREVPDDAD